MAKIITPSYITGISGKVCGHENNEYRTNKSSGKIILSKKCNPYQGPLTEAQIQAQNTFKARNQVLNKWLKDNHPTKANEKGTALYQEAVTIKKTLRLDNIQTAISLYQKHEAPFTIQLPSQGGTMQKKIEGMQQNSGGGNTNSGSESGSGDHD